MPDPIPADVRTPHDLDLDLDAATHRRLAAGCFNHAWTLMEREDRDAEGDRLLLEVAHASRLHWRHVGEDVHLARAAWLLSRVLAVLGHHEQALDEGRHCLAIVDAAGLGPFDRAFAHEAIARARHLAGDRQGAADALAAAHIAAVEIAEGADREWVRRNLAALDVPPSA